MNPATVDGARDGDAAPSARRALRLALWCALAPALLGVAATAGWLASGGLLDELAPYYAAGAAAIVLGLVATPTGVVALVIARRRGAPRGPVTRRALALLFNFPLAFACTAVADIPVRLQVVTVENASDVPVTDLWIGAVAPRPGWPSRELAQLPPGATARWSFLPSTEGAVGVRYRQGELRCETPADQGAFCGWGEPVEIHVTIRDDGEHRVESQAAQRWHWAAVLSR